MLAFLFVYSREKNHKELFEAHWRKTWAIFFEIQGVLHRSNFHLNYLFYGHLEACFVAHFNEGGELQPSFGLINVDFVYPLKKFFVLEQQRVNIYRI